MPGKTWKYFSFCLCLALIVGCSYTKKVQVRSYWQEKKRVDQNFDGNQGYLQGAPAEMEQNRKETRKIFTVEVTENAPKVDESLYMIEDKDSGVRSSSRMQQPAEKQPARTSQVQTVVPIRMQAQPQEQKTVPKYAEYTVEKDDTLQKIAKKFYGNYSLWMKIYDTNKDVIKNPDRIKPGTVLKIPLEK